MSSSETVHVDTSDDRLAKTRIPCSVRVRDEVLKPLKRENETYDDLLRRLAARTVADTLVNEFEMLLDRQTEVIIKQTSHQTAVAIEDQLADTLRTADNELE